MAACFTNDFRSDHQNKTMLAIMSRKFREVSLLRTHNGLPRGPMGIGRLANEILISSSSEKGVAGIGQKQPIRAARGLAGAGVQPIVSAPEAGPGAGFHRRCGSSGSSRLVADSRRKASRLVGVRGLASVAGEAGLGIKVQRLNGCPASGARVFKTTRVPVRPFSRTSKPVASQSVMPHSLSGRAL